MQLFEQRLKIQTPERPGKWRLGSALRAALLAVAAASVAPAFAETYTGPRGWSTELPAGWSAVEGQARRAVIAQLRRTSAADEAEFQRVDTFLAGPRPDVSAVVFVEPGEMPTDEAGCDLAGSRLRENYAHLGGRVAKLAVQSRRLAGGARAVVLDYELLMPSAPVPSRNIRAYVPGGGATVILHFSAPAAEAAGHVEAFTALLDAVRVRPLRAAGRDDFWVLRSPLRIAAVAAVIAALAGATVLLRRRSSSPAAAPDPGPTAAQQAGGTPSPESRETNPSRRDGGAA